MTDNCEQLTPNGHGERLSRKQEQAIAALLASPTVEAAAATIGVAPITLRRWGKEPAFADAYREARREALAHAIASVQRATTTAVQTLEAVMRDAAAPAGSRVAAAKAVIDIAVKGVEMEELEDRMLFLETIMGDRKAERARWN